MNLAHTFVQNIRLMVTGYKNQNARRKALSSALTSATSIHQEYSGVGFDEQFMENTAAGLMEPFLAGGSLPTPDALLAAWSSQFPFSEEGAQRAIANITPMVTEFLYVLGSEVQSVEMLTTEAAGTSIIEQPSAIHIEHSYAGVS